MPILEPRKYYRSTPFYPAVGNRKMFMKVRILSIVRSANILFNKMVTRNEHAEVRRIRKHVPIGGQTVAVIRKNLKIKLTDDEAAELKSSKYPVGYALLGVMKQQMSKPELVIQKHDLMFENPGEQCNYFNIFWKYCIEKQSILFCSYRFSKRSINPSFCEMIPKAYNNKRCFLIKYLYFRESILVDPESPFQNDEQTTEEPSDDTMNEVRKLVDGLTFSYSPMAFFDVEEAKKEAYLRAQALDQPMEHVENFLDDKDKINKVLDDLGIIQKRKFEVKEGQNSQRSKR